MDFISSSAFLRLCCKLSKKTIFYLPVNTDQPSRFLGTCCYSCFICRYNVVFRNCHETGRHIDSCSKTMNSQGCFELREPIRTLENCVLLIWQILNLSIFPGLCFILSRKSRLETQPCFIRFKGTYHPLYFLYVLSMNFYSF